MKNSKTPHRGFTLIELLVVISIISLLMAILLPVLSSTREQASKTKCASNIRQLHLMITYYAGDERGFYPPVDSNRPNAWIQWRTPANNWYAFGGAYDGYFTSKQVMLCPSRDEKLVDGNYDGEIFDQTTYYIAAGTGVQPITSSGSRNFWGRIVRNGSTADNQWYMWTPNNEFGGRTFETYGDGTTLYGSIYIYPDSEQPAFVEPHTPEGLASSPLWVPFGYSNVLSGILQSHTDGGNVHFIDGHGRWAKSSESTERIRTQLLSNSFYF